MYSQVKTLLSILWHSEPPSFSVAMETFLPSVCIYSSSLFTRGRTAWVGTMAVMWVDVHEEEQENNNDKNHLEH